MSSDDEFDVSSEEVVVVRETWKREEVEDEE